MRHLHGLTIIMAALLFENVTIDQTASAEDDPRRPAAISTEHVPRIPDALWDRQVSYLNTRAAGFRGWAPNGSGILIQTRFGNTSQLHRVYQPGGRREQVTFFEEPANGQFLPGTIDGTLLISMATGGNERYQVYISESVGEAELLTDGKSRNLLGPVRDDGLFCLIASNERNGKDTDLYIADPNRPGSRELLFQTDSEYWIPEDWSRDGSKVLIRQYVSINECYPALLDVGSQKKVDIPIPGGGPSAFGQMAFSNDGESAFLSCDSDTEFPGMSRRSLSLRRVGSCRPTICLPSRSTKTEPAGCICCSATSRGASSCRWASSRRLSFHRKAHSSALRSAARISRLTRTRCVWPTAN